MVKDWYVTISQAEKHPSITHLTTFARQSSWMKVWDYALDRGSAGTSLGTRPSLTEEEEGLVNLHTYKFEVRGISAE